MVYDLKLAKAAGLALDRFPESEEEGRKAEDALAAELNKLSLDEHEKVLFDIHGITPSEEEEPAMVKSKLQEMEMALQNIQQKDAYNLALQLDTGHKYVQSQDFRLMFLRAKNFEPQASALLMVDHFEMKKKLFGGGEILAREIRQADLTPTEITILESGYIQVLPSRDASGRTVMFLSTAYMYRFPQDGWEDINEQRAVWYQSMAMLRDVETQKRGSVYMLMNFHSYKITVENFEGIARLDAAIPSRVFGGHYCFDDPEMKPYVAGFKVFIKEHDRFRLRTHFGSRDEIDFTLHTYGLPVDTCPESKDGTLHIHDHLAWLAMHRAQEIATPVVSKQEVGSKNVVNDTSVLGDFIGIPRRFDVLFGKSTRAKEHTGTRRCLHVVEMHFDTYEELPKYQKTDMAEKIISIIHESGGRFLKEKGDGSWIEAPEVEAKRKIAHWFRHSRSKRKSETKNPSSSSASSSAPTPMSVSSIASKRVYDDGSNPTYAKKSSFTRLSSELSSVESPPLEDEENIQVNPQTVVNV